MYVADMASETSSGLNPSPEDARDALNALGSDRARLADKVTTPGWYHSIVAILTAAAAIAPVLPMPWALAVPAVFLILIAVFSVFARRNGIVMSAYPIGRATRFVLGLQVGTFMVFMVASAAVRVFDLGWGWLAPIAISVFVVILFLAKRYDRVQRVELTGQGYSG